MTRTLPIALALAGCAAVPEAVVPLAVAPAVQPDVARPVFDVSGRFSQGGLAIGRAPAGTTSLTLDGQTLAVAPDGRFVIGFGRDHPASARLVATLGDGRPIERVLAIAPRAWRIESLSSLAPRPRPDAEFARIRPGELAEIERARATGSDSEGWRQALRWPVTGRISGLFGAQRIYRGEPGAYHSGVDVARATGTPFVAPADGVVTLAAARPFTLEGNLLIVDHGMGLSSAFLHLSRIDVRVGQRVRQGQSLGAIGATGRATGPHLHWGMKWRDQRIDPLLLAGPIPSG